MARGATELRASMTLKRPLTFFAMLACLLLAAPAAADDSGGVAVESYDAAGGGILAPEQEPVASAAAADPVAEPAQEQTPTTPEGEEQPEGEENGEQPTTEENGGEEPMDLPGDVGAGDESGGSLPRTGFELVALTAIGLGLLLAGGALWPTSSWPPPRDRLSRSTPRR
jgi:hypothetical protein